MNWTAADWIASVFGIGKLPLAPGTWCSFIAVVAWYFLFPKLDFIVLPIAAGIIFLVGVFLSNKVVQRSQDPDPSRIVIDEWAGQWIALSMSPVTLSNGLLGFLFFRIFDILKPPPIRRLELLPGGWAVMADDVMAGIMAWFVLMIYNAYIV